MFCQNCGSANDDDAAFCIKCGAAIGSGQSPQNTAPAHDGGNDNVIAIVGFVLSFFVAVAGLVCSIIGYKNSKNGTQYKGLAVAGIVISAASIVIAVITVIITIIVITAGLSAL